MPTITVYQSGATAGMPGRGGARPPRSEVRGWSDDSTRSNTRFLYSVVAQGLTGHGFALSLTVRNCPPTHAHWAAARNAFMDRLRRMGLIRMHWLTEWQRRGVPHMHAAVWLPDDKHAAELRGRIIGHWLDVAGEFGAGPRGQHVAHITDAVGWFQYLAKHAARGVSHYQRSDALIPAGWQKTGRMWGQLGDWPRREGMRFEVGREAFFEFRRIARGWRHADARASGQSGRIIAARRMLSCPDRSRSELRGVSEWIPQDMTLAVLAFLGGQGWEIVQVG